MNSSVAKWGNSLAVRLPQNVIRAAKLSSGSKLDIEVKGGHLILKKRSADLDELVSRISPANRHTEVATGEVTGRETW